MWDAMAFLQNRLDTDMKPEEERRRLKRKISLTSCDVCESEEAKYRCPNCLKSSCSLACVKEHKLRSGCSGVRDRTAFVPLSHFSELHLLSDYRFLEETSRVADRPNRDALLHTRSRHSYSAMLLLRNAKAAKVNLKILPKSFSRRRENTSIYNKTPRSRKRDSSVGDVEGRGLCVTPTKSSSVSASIMETENIPHLIKEVQQRIKHKGHIHV